MTKSDTKKFEAAFAKLTDKQQAEIRKLTEACNKAAADYAAAGEEEQRTSEEQRRVFMRYEKRAKALGLPVPDEICFE